MAGEGGHEVKQTLLMQVTMQRETGLPLANDKERAQAALSLWAQGQTFLDKDEVCWTVGTVMHLPDNEAQGRRAVCAEEGHVIPEKPRGTVFGCKRCDVVFGEVRK
jgi:hypothetical protein